MRSSALMLGKPRDALRVLPNPAATPKTTRARRRPREGHRPAVRRINDPSIAEYVQRVENRLALAAGVMPLEIRLTRNAKSNALILPNGILYISSGMLDRMASEAELAGLLAHETAHLPWETSLTDASKHSFVSAAVCPFILTAGCVDAHRMDEGAARTGTPSNRHSRENPSDRRL